MEHINNDITPTAMIPTDPAIIPTIVVVVTPSWLLIAGSGVGVG